MAAIRAYAFLLALFLATLVSGSYVSPGWKSASGEGTICVEGKCPAPLDNAYMSFEQMEFYLDHIENVYGDQKRVEVNLIGTTHLSNNLYEVIVRPYRMKGTTKNAKPNLNRESIYIDAGSDARGLITSATAFHMIHKLATDCTEHCLYDWHFIPLLNPDGYEYNKNHNQSWIKNRQPGIDCAGVNINFNFEFEKITVHRGGSNNSCDWNYYGSAPTVEMSALSRMRMIPQNTLLTLSFLNTGNQILRPYAGYAGEYSPTYIDLGAAFTSAIAGAGNGAVFGSDAYHSYNGERRVGTSMEECMNVDCATHSLTLLLREGEEGGNPPPTDILSSKAEILVGVNAIIDFINSNDFVYENK